MNLEKNKSKIKLNTNPDKGFIYHFSISTILFSIYCIWFRTPLVADDHRFLMISLNEGFNFWGIGDAISRTPIYSIIFYTLLKLDYHQSTFYLFYILLFSIHSSAIFITTRKIVSIFENTEYSHINNFKLLVPITVLLSFHPNFLEILLMPGAAIYVIGALFMSLSFYFSNYILIFIFSFLSFGTYESYFFPIFAFPFLVFLTEKFEKIKVKALLLRLTTTSLAFILFYYIRSILINKVGLFQRDIDPNWMNNWERIWRYFSRVFTIGYDHTISTNIENTLIVTILFITVAKYGLKPVKSFLLLLIFGLITSALDLFVTYEGIRVVYGSFYFKAAAITYLLYIFGNSTKLYLWYIPITILSIIYICNLRSIYKIRLHDYINQKNYEKLILAVSQKNEPSKSIMLPSNDIHFHPYDWALEPNSIIQPLVFKAIHKLEKNINFKIIGYDTLKFDTSEFPVFFPARSFVHNYGRKWELDNQSFTGQIYHVEKGFYGNVIWGPYMRLDKGNYSIDVALKIDSNLIKTEFGGISILQNSGRDLVKNFHLTSDNCSSRNFKNIQLNFQLIEASNDLEFQFFNNGVTGFKVDYIRINKLELADSLTKVKIEDKNLIENLLKVN